MADNKIKDYQELNLGEVKTGPTKKATEKKAF